MYKECLTYFIFYISLDFSPIPLYLLLGQILPVNISHINSETDFHIQLLPGVANELHNHILNYISDTKVKLFVFSLYLK